MLVAGPNLTLDRTSTIPELRPGEVLRLADVVVTPGGKGLNVARAALALGAPAVLVAFVPGHTGRAVAAMIADEGVELQRVPAAGEIRSTSIVLEPDGRATVLNEPGPRLDAWEPLQAAGPGALAGHGALVCSGSLPPGALAGHGVLVCSGSLPPGAPDDGYARLTALAHAAGARAVGDAGGAVLAAALRAAPDVVTPNLGEAEGVLHGRAG